MTAETLVFTSYAHEDEPHRRRWQEHLAALQRRGLVKSWSDHDVQAGAAWSPEIMAQLEAAQVIVLLVSSAFIASDFCWETELKRALERREKGEAHVVPVLVRPAAWADTPLAELLAVPDDGQPITLWSDQDAAWVQVVHKIEELLRREGEHEVDRRGSPAWTQWPRPRSPLLIGRERELNTVRDLLTGGHRLVTLVGPAGVGKSHLALHAGLAARESFRDGAHQIPLSGLPHPDLVEFEIASRLGITEGGTGLRERIRDKLGDREVLLLLDGFDELTGATSLVCDLLDVCPGVTVLVTSRRVLGQSGEYVVNLDPLQVPAPDSGEGVEAIGAYPSVQLLMARAVAAGVELKLTRREAPVIAALCRRLAGLPHAIELTAKQLATMSPAEALERLPQVVEPLARSISLSVAALDPAAARLFAQLGVFADGCTLAAARAVCDSGPATHDKLKDLLQISLLRPGFEAGDFRYLMLQPIREHAAALLRRDERLDLYRRHADYYVRLAEDLEPRLESAAQEECVAEADAAYGNLREVLTRAAEGSVDLETGLRLAGALGPLWYVRGLFSQGRHWLERLLETDGAAREPVRAKALVLAGIMTYHQCDYRLARRHLEHALAIFRSLDDSDETRDLLRELNYRHPDEGVAKSLNCLGFVSKEEGDYDESVGLYEESLRLYRRAGRPWGVAWTATDLALALLSQDSLNADRAVALLEESLDHHEESDGQPAFHALTLLYLAYARLAQGLEVEAADLADEALQRSRDLEYARGVSLAAHLAGLLALNADRHDVALSLFREALEQRRSQGDRAGVAEAADGLAAALTAAGHPRSGARLLGYADRAWSRVGGRRTHPEYAAAAAALDARTAAIRVSDFASATASGRRLTFDEVLAELDLHRADSSGHPAGDR